MLNKMFDHQLISIKGLTNPKMNTTLPGNRDWLACVLASPFGWLVKGIQYAPCHTRIRIAWLNPLVDGVFVFFKLVVSCRYQFSPPLKHFRWVILLFSFSNVLNSCTNFFYSFALQCCTRDNHQQSFSFFTHQNFTVYVFHFSF